MCRIFAYSGDLGSEELKSAVTEFAKLAVHGSVPLGIEPGHTDGWGLYASNGGKEIYVRSAGEAKADKLLTALQPVRGQGQVLIHLRKATVGANKVANTHPFLRSGVVFCHNGSIRSFPDSPVGLLEGDTDSEKYFMRILSRMSDTGLTTMQAAVEAEVKTLQEGEWTSLTCVLKSKDGLVLNYLWNEAHTKTEEMRLNDYYTFFRGIKGEATILCSELLEVRGFSWQPLINGTLVVV